MGDGERWEQAVFQAFQSFVRLGLMSVDGDDYAFDATIVMQFQNENNLTSVRKAQNERSARRNKRKKAKQAEEAAAATERETAGIVALPARGAK